MNREELRRGKQSVQEFWALRKSFTARIGNVSFVYYEVNAKLTAKVVGPAPQLLIVMIWMCGYIGHRDLRRPREQHTSTVFGRVGHEQFL